MSGPGGVTLRCQRHLDARWQQEDIQQVLSRDGLCRLWNQMLADGELAGAFSDGVLNSAGAVARRGACLQGMGVDRAVRVEALHSLLGGGGIFWKLIPTESHVYLQRWGSLHFNKKYIMKRLIITDGSICCYLGVVCATLLVYCFTEQYTPCFLFLSYSTAYM